MTALTHPQPQKSVYSSKKNYQHWRGTLSFMRESGFQAQNKFREKKSEEYWRNHDFNFIREARQEDFRGEHKALVSSPQTECNLPAWLKGDNWQNETVL